MAQTIESDDGQRVAQEDIQEVEENWRDDLLLLDIVNDYFQPI